MYAAPKDDHYAALGVAPSASPEEVRAAFRAAALRAHPDRASPASSDEFVRVQMAWEVLSDPAARREYDAARAAAAARAQVAVADRVAASGMERQRGDDGEVLLCWPCRCGGTYAALESELTGGGAGGAEVLVPCSTCSLHIAVEDA